MFYPEENEKRRIKNEAAMEAFKAEWNVPKANRARATRWILTSVAVGATAVGLFFGLSNRNRLAQYAEWGGEAAGAAASVYGVSKNLDPRRYATNDMKYIQQRAIEYYARNIGWEPGGRPKWLTAHGVKYPYR